MYVRMYVLGTHTVLWKVYIHTARSVDKFGNSPRRIVHTFFHNLLRLLKTVDRSLVSGPGTGSSLMWDRRSVAVEPFREQ